MGEAKRKLARQVRQHQAHNPPEASEMNLHSKPHHTVCQVVCGRGGSATTRNSRDPGDLHLPVDNRTSTPNHTFRTIPHKLPRWCAAAGAPRQRGTWTWWLALRRRTNTENLSPSSSRSSPTSTETPCPACRSVP